MSMTSKVHISLLCCNKNKKNKHFNCKPTLENECELKIFKTCSVYLRVRPFWIYTTVSFFIIFFPLPVCVLKIFSILKKNIVNLFMMMSLIEIVHTHVHIIYEQYFTLCHIV